MLKIVAHPLAGIRRSRASKTPTRTTDKATIISAAGMLNAATCAATPHAIAKRKRNGVIKLSKINCTPAQEDFWRACVTSGNQLSAPRGVLTDVFHRATWATLG